MPGFRCLSRGSDHPLTSSFLAKRGVQNFPSAMRRGAGVVGQRATTTPQPPPKPGGDSGKRETAHEDLA